MIQADSNRIKSSPKPKITALGHAHIDIIVVSARFTPLPGSPLVPELIKTNAAIIQGHLEINGCFGARNGRLVVGGFKTGRTTESSGFMGWRKSRKRADIKTALARLPNQGRFIYPCLRFNFSNGRQGLPQFQLRFN